MSNDGMEPAGPPSASNVQPAAPQQAADPAIDNSNPATMSNDGMKPAGSPSAPNVQPAAPQQAADPENNATDSAVASGQRQWKRENLLDKCMLVSRALCWLFSLISFFVMASNKQGDGENFDIFPEYQYCLAIAIIAFLYATGQVVYQVYRLGSEKFLIPKRATCIMDFTGDQVIAYLLMSASSAAIPTTNWLRGVVDGSFTGSAAASISMAFLAFASIALSALMSGYKLSTQTYI